MTLEALAKQLRAEALEYPETYEEQPWGERVVKVKGKIFFTCGVHEGKLYASCKLPESSKKVLARPYAEPTHYGMGKHGWVTFRFARENEVPIDELRAWMGESFRAIAPKKLSAPSAVRPPPSAPERKAEGGRRKAATKAKAKAKAKAILVCEDQLRARRAVEALGARGVALDVVGRANGVKLGRAKAVIVDLGRNPVEGLALAAKIDASDAEVHLFVAGVRDADQACRLRALGSAESFRAPPGDAAVADAVAQSITGGARRGS